MSSDFSVNSTPKNEVRVLLDGWSLIHDPCSPAALHLWELITALAQKNILVALPAEPPQWLGEDVPVFVTNIVKNTSKDRLNWQQIVLPRIANQHQIQIIHTPQFIHPLFAQQRWVISPTSFKTPSEHPHRRSVWERLEFSIQQSGLSRQVLTLLPQGYPLTPQSEFNHNPVFIPPLIQNKPSTFARNDSSSSPPNFVYWSTGNPFNLNLLLKGWAKTVGAVGENAHLTIIPSSAEETAYLRHSCSSELLQSLTIRENLSPFSLYALVQEALAVILLDEEPPWGGAGRLASNLGVPVVGTETPYLASLVGQGAYLVPAGDIRGLSAAFITFVVDEEFTFNMKQKAQPPSNLEAVSQFTHSLWEIYLFPPQQPRSK
jgi:glycosyltransferase involved in cell wall biosynthesis